MFPFIGGIVGGPQAVPDGPTSANSGNAGAPISVSFGQPLASSSFSSSSSLLLVLLVVGGLVLFVRRPVRSS